MENKIKEKLKTLVSEKRYNHSLMVAEEARRLASIYDVPEQTAYLTGLAHDIAKNFSEEENRYWVSKYSLDAEILNPDYRNLIHADIGAVVAKEWFDFSDEMCSAIRYHTIGHSTMTPLEKIIFIADKTARDNLSEELTEVKKASYEDLDQALLIYLENQENRLKERGFSQHPETKQLVENLKKSS